MRLKSLMVSGLLIACSAAFAGGLADQVRARPNKAAAAPDAADLLPIPPNATSPGNGAGSDYCARSGNKLVVRIFNRGRVASAPSKTGVEYKMGPAHGAQFYVNTPSIPPGGFATLSFPDGPAGCFASDCHFTIQADADRLNPESNESNNLRAGWCVG